MSQWFQRIKNFSQQYLNFQPDEEEGLDRESPDADAPEATQPLTERDYEFLFSQLLEGVAHGWSPERVQRFFAALDDRSSPQSWLAWLQRYGAKVLATATPSSDLAQRLIAFGDQSQELSTWQPLGETARGIGRMLLESDRRDLDTWDVSEPEASAPVSSTLPIPPAAAPATPPAAPPSPPAAPAPPAVAEPEPVSPAAEPAASASADKTISLDELLVRLQQDENLVQQVAQRLGLETREPQAIVQELVRQIEQRQTGSAPASPPSNDAAEQTFNRGVQQYESGDFEGAIASWEQAIEQKPDYHQAWGNRGLGLKNLGRYEEAIASYDRALELKPDFFKAWYNRGLALDELNRHEEAIASYNEVIKLKPDFYKAWYSRGNSLDRVGSRGEALESYGKALELQPNFHKAWLGQAASLERAGRYAAAADSYDNALRLRPDEAEVWSQRSACLLAAGREEAAIAGYERALALRPNDPVLLWRRGQAQANTGNWSAALADYDQASNLKPEFAEVFCSRGAALAAQGQFGAAIAACDRALALQPGLAPAWQLRGEALAAQGEVTEALTSYDKAIRVQPDNIAAWAGRGRALATLAQPEAAIGSYDKALQLQTDNWQLWAGRGEAAQQSAQPDLLITSLSEIAQREPRLNQRGFEGEIASLEQGLHYLSPENDAVGRGRLLWRLGRARYHYGQTQADPAPHWRQALNDYTAAMTALAPETQPLAHLEALQDRVAVHLSLEEGEAAKTWQKQGLAQLEALLTDEQLPAERQRESALTLAPLYQFGVDIAVQAGEFVPALESALRSQSVTQAWLLDQPQLRQAFPAWETIQQLCRPGTAIVTWHLSPAALTTFVIRAGTSEPTVLGRTPNVVLNVVLSPSLRARVDSARENSDASLGILLELLGLEPEASPEIPPAPLETAAAVDEVADAINRRQRLIAWLTQWDAQQAAADAAAWPDLLAQLSEILNLPALFNELEPAGIDKVILVPHQELRRVPLHALFPERLTVAYLNALPLALYPLGLAAPAVAATDPWLKEQATLDWALAPTGSPLSDTERSLLSIEYPEPTADGSEASLPPGTAWEAAAICQYCGSFKRLAGAQATRAEVQSSLASGHRLFHYLGHYTNNRQNPSQSAFQLSDGDRLSSRDWDDLPWENYYLASFALPATPLGQAPAADTADVAGALLSRGVGYVVSALWTTAPEVRVLLTVEFYRRFLGGTPPPQALQQTQQWLRRARALELVQWYRERASELADAPGELAQTLAVAAERWQATAATNAGDPPYANPYYWASLAIAARNLDWLG